MSAIPHPSMVFFLLSAAEYRKGRDHYKCYEIRDEKIAVSEAHNVSSRTEVDKSCMDMANSAAALLLYGSTSMVITQIILSVRFRTF